MHSDNFSPVNWRELTSLPSDLLLGTRHLSAPCLYNGLLLGTRILALSRVDKTGLFALPPYT